MSTNPFNLTDKVALVTGASRGLGRGMAIGLAEAGADVALVARSDAVQETKAAIEHLGRRATAIQADVTGAGAAERIVAQVVEALGRLDILVNNAGTTARHKPEDFPEADWDRVLDVNLKSVWMLCQAAGRHMLSRGGGKIVNITSLLSFSGGILVPAYAASKGAVAQLTKALANDWAARGIHVNAIAPGYMATELTEAIRNDPQRNPAILSRIPAGRWGTPQDLAGPAVFLASDASDYLHGHVLLVDGGWMAR